MSCPWPPETSQALGWPDVPPPVRAAFEAARRINAARNALVARALGRVLEGLGRVGVPVIPLKGVALSESLYGDAALRVSADLDLLVPRDGVARAWTVLGELGYAMADHEERVEASELGLLLESNIEYAFASPEAAGCPVELHWDIAWRWPHSAPAIADLWADARPRPFRGAPALALGPEWELLYLAVHAARHRWDALKWLVDVHEICRAGRSRLGEGPRQGGSVRPHGRARDQSPGLGGPLRHADSLRAPRARSLPAGSTSSRPRPIRSISGRGRSTPRASSPGPRRSSRYLARVLLMPTLAERRLIRLPRGPSEPSTILCVRCAWGVAGGSIVRRIGHGSRVA